jgi:hypothetical protein
MIHLLSSRSLRHPRHNHYHPPPIGGTIRILPIGNRRYLQRRWLGCKCLAFTPKMRRSCPSVFEGGKRYRISVIM